MGALRPNWEGTVVLRCARLAAAALALTLPLALPASAGEILPGVYQLLDHGDGQLGTDYGLRVDAIGEVFSVELNGASLLLTWDGGTTANISGTLNENSMGGMGGIGPIWTIDYDLTGVSAVGTLGFTATGGSGVLTDPFLVDTVLSGETNGSGFVFEFLADGFRIDGDNDTPVGRGWLMPSGTTNDWIVRAVLIPEPATGLLLGLGLAGLAALRRRQA